MFSVVCFQLLFKVEDGYKITHELIFNSEDLQLKEITLSLTCKENCETTSHL